MNPKKLAAGALILIGVVFRAISLAHYHALSARVPSTGPERRRLEGRKQRALYVDYAFIVFGAYLLVA